MAEAPARPKPPTIRERLSSVEDGWYGPAEARSAVRNAFAPRSPDPIRALGYAALRSAAWRLLRQAEVGDAAAWGEVFDIAARLCIEGGRTEEAARVAALGELVGQRVAFDEANAYGSLASKPSVRQVASVLAANRGSMGLRDLCEQGRLPQEIGARVVGAMSAAGYVIAEGDGKRRSVSLTPEGMALAASLA